MVKLRIFLPVLLVVPALPAEENPIAQGFNQFALDSYAQASRRGENVIFSPFSIFTALSMTLAGARGQTAEEIARVLHQPYPDPGYHAALTSLFGQVSSAANAHGTEWSNANSLWVDRQFRLQPDFLHILESAYKAPQTAVDFAQDPERARTAINRWTSEKTKGKIGELFAPGALDSTARLVLASATYFYGKWECPFKPQETKAAPFRLAGGGTAQADFMQQSTRFGYSETPTLQILEMKYADGSLAFDILLPKSVDGLPELEKSLRPETLATWLGSLATRRVDVALPKFRVESAFSLRDALSAMGMPAAFQSTADFSGIDGRHDLYLSQVMHKAFVSVSEEGTEAAAATGSVVSLTSAVIQPRIVFRADHPFVFFIRDTRSGLIVFAGRVGKPKA